MYFIAWRVGLRGSLSSYHCQTLRTSPGYQSHSRSRRHWAARNDLPQVAAEIEANAAATVQTLRQPFNYPPGIDSFQGDAYCQAQQER